MISKKTLALSAALLLTTTSFTAQAQDHSHHDHAHHMSVSAGSTDHTGHDHTKSIEPNSLMGTHLHDKGEWMVSYRYNYMRMEDMRNGTNDLSDAEVIALPNPYAPPANLRVVPVDMDMHMHMFGAMYGVTDWMTIMGMAMYMKKDMDHNTYNMMGNKIGSFETSSGGIGDLKGSAVIRLYEGKNTQLLLNAGLSLPTGSITEDGEVLTPMGTTMTLRLPYAMQLGSGTIDFHPGLTYSGNQGHWGWGAQYAAEIRLEDENDEGYSLGNKHQFHLWGGYSFDNGLILGSRLSYTTQDDIEGRDTNISAPVPTANPDNYGGDWGNVGLFANYSPSHPEWQGHVFGVEADLPIYQDLNGPQMKQDYGLTLRWSYGF
tara:strand:+ start:580710 stop:581831 length:1122 start_codon:yes stop_codon:yes gene_type:complete